MAAWLWSLPVGIDEGEVGEHDGSDKRQGPALGWPKKLPEMCVIAARWCDVTGCNRSHDDAHVWSKMIDYRVRKL